MAQITLGGGCFWCIDAVLKDIDGVTGLVSGYAGGTTERPSYEEVCAGKTGHAEVVQVGFDPDVLPLADLLRIFFTIHDPTTKNRQGNDVGTQYRSAVFTEEPGQDEVVRAVMGEVADAYPAPIVTEVGPLEVFWPAEEYHQDYYVRNPGQGYCQAVIAPKVAKLRAQWADRLKA